MRVLILALFLTSAVACSNSSDELAACRYDVEKVLVQAPKCPPDKWFCEEEQRGTLVQSCMEAKAFRLNQERLEKNSLQVNRFIEAVVVNDPSVWDPPNVFGKPVREVGKRAFVETWKMRNIFTDK